MTPTLHNIEHDQDASAVRVNVSFGRAEPSRYLASYDDSDSRTTCCNVEPELFMALSNFAQKRFGDCSIYQMELMAIIGAFTHGELDLELPASLGTPKYCVHKPSVFGAVWNIIAGRFTVAMWKIGINRPKPWIATKNERVGQPTRI